jgi:hypothetical protein
MIPGKQGKLDHWRHHFKNLLFPNTDGQAESMILPPIAEKPPYEIEFGSTLNFRNTKRD